MERLLVSSETNLGNDKRDSLDAGFVGEPAISSATSLGCSFDHELAGRLWLEAVEIKICLRFTPGCLIWKIKPYHQENKV